MDDRFVICMKWGTKYGPEYVNRLYGMVSRHLHGAFRFVCFTDDTTGIRPEVENFRCPNCNCKPASSTAAGESSTATRPISTG